MATRLPALNLSVQYPGGTADAPSRPAVRRYLRATCDLPAEVTVRFVDEQEGRALNRDYRHKDYATNVLSFPYVQEETQIVGDLALCIPVALREAAEQGKAAEAHFAHLIVHGMLHLMGYDHETSTADAEAMEALETSVMQQLGFADPSA
jgi:probable rRNA maturation factor